MAGMNTSHLGASRSPGSLRLILGLIAALTLSLAACSSSPGADSGRASAAGSNATVISLKSLMFMPEKLTVQRGTKVTWRNDEPITHTVTSGAVTGLDKGSGLRTGQKPDGRFNRTLKGKGDTFSYTFTKPGTYPYYCDIHFGMNAEIVVTG